MQRKEERVSWPQHEKYLIFRVDFAIFAVISQGSKENIKVSKFNLLFKPANISFVCPSTVEKKSI